MKDKEFIVEDTCAILWKEFLNDLNLEYAKTGKIFESVAGKSIGNFISLHSEIPSIGQSYYFLTILWMGGDDIVSISIAKSDELFEVVKIEDSGRITVKNNITQQYRSFPEIPGPVTSNIQGSSLFTTIMDRDQFLMLFRLKFSECRIIEKQL